MIEWVISVSSVVVFNVLITLILPSGKLSNYISFILAILFVFVMVKPIFSFDVGEIFNNTTSIDNIDINYEFLSYTNQLKAKNKEENCIKILEDRGYDVQCAKIDYDKDNYEHLVIKKVEIFLNIEVINSNNSHIDINDEIKTLVSKYLDIDKGVIHVIS